MNSPYEDIIHLPHHVSSSHPHMPRKDRAAQFAPFAALTGYGEMIQEQSRLTQPEKELSEEVQEALQRKLHFLGAHIREQPKLHVVWFQKDAKKAGGAYRHCSGILKKIDTLEKILIQSEGTRIPLIHIAELDSPLFSDDF